MYPESSSGYLSSHRQYLWRVLGISLSCWPEGEGVQPWDRPPALQRERGGRSAAVGSPTGAAEGERGKECSRGIAHRRCRGREGEGVQPWDRPPALQRERVVQPWDRPPDTERCTGVAGPPVPRHPRQSTVCPHTRCSCHPRRAYPAPGGAVPYSSASSPPGNTKDIGSPKRNSATSRGHRPRRFVPTHYPSFWTEKESEQSRVWVTLAIGDESRISDFSHSTGTAQGAPPLRR